MPLLRQAIQRAQLGLLNRTQYPSDVIALVVLWRLRYKLSLRDLTKMFLIRGIAFSDEAVRDWEAKLTLTLAEALRRRRRRKAGRSWCVDETYVKIQGHRCRASAIGGLLGPVRPPMIRLGPSAGQVILMPQNSENDPRGIPVIFLR
jgi:hypothetical protein